MSTKPNCRPTNPSAHSNRIARVTRRCGLSAVTTTQHRPSAAMRGRHPYEMRSGHISSGVKKVVAGVSDSIKKAMSVGRHDTNKVASERRALKRRRPQYHHRFRLLRPVAQQRNHLSVRSRRCIHAVDARRIQRPAVTGGLGLLGGQVAPRKRQQAGLVEGVATAGASRPVRRACAPRRARTGRRGCAAAR